MSAEANVRDWAESARRVIRIEADSVVALSNQIGLEFSQAIEALLSHTGRVIVCGMGKSGIIGHKIAATLMSTGTPSFYMHPGEAYHGDLGMVTASDAFLAISNSGETEELLRLLPYLKVNGNYLVSLTGNPLSTLAKAAHVNIDVSVKAEACPHQLAPTSSTTAALVMGDAIAIALMEARGFTPADFARYHPGGSLGRRLLSTVADEMQPVPQPLLRPGSDFSTVVEVITTSNVGLAVVDQGDGSWALITDGDLRRAVRQYGPAVFTKAARDMMTVQPTMVAASTRSEEAFNLMERQSIAALLVHEGGDLVGVFKK